MARKPRNWRDANLRELLDKNVINKYESTRIKKEHE